MQLAPVLAAVQWVASHAIQAIAALHAVLVSRAVASFRVVPPSVPDYWEPRNPTVAQQLA